MNPLNLDMDILRTLVTARELGGFNRAADHIGRSQSAVSQQIRKLEEQVGEPLFRKDGRGLKPTEAGEVILRYARRILDLNDEAITAVRGMAVAGTVRFGVPADLAETWLPKILGQFKRAHPAVLIEAIVDRNSLLLDRLDKGQLDLALAFGAETRPDAELLATLPMAWLGPASGGPVLRPDQPLSLVMYGAPCLFRQAGIEALDKAGIAWHTAFTSLSVHGLWAAVEAGLGVTLRTTLGLPRSLTVLGKESGLPPVPTISLALHDAGRELSPVVGWLRTILTETLSDGFDQLAMASKRSAEASPQLRV